MVMVTVAPGTTSVVVPDRSMVPSVLSILSMESVRSPGSASRVAVSESETGLPLRSVPDASTVIVPSTRPDKSTSGTS